MLSNHVFIIAEAGVNHNGDIALAKRLIDAAASAKADAVKFQTFRAENIVSRFAQKGEYQKKAFSGSESQLEMLKRLELDLNAHKELISYSKEKGIIFSSTPFDLESIELLDKLGLEILKIGSGEITDLPFLRRIGCLGRRLILSTGMADLKEIKAALDVLTEAGTELSNITVLHCNSAYPTPMKDVNLSAMITIRDTFKVKVGYSDHTPGVEVPIAAVALGAQVIEKHLTLDKSMDGPDHHASLDPDELKEMVRAIRNIQDAIGSSVKKPSPSEIKNLDISRKSIVAARDIAKGERLNEDNLTIKRPGNGISPFQWDKIIGRIALRDYSKDELIQ